MLSKGTIYGKVSRFIAAAMATLAMVGGGLLVWAHLSEPGRGYLLCGTGLCGSAPPTIESEPTNPFGWSDLAEERASNGDIAGAREAFARSVGLGPNIPPVLIRVVNFEVANGELGRAVPHLRHILELTSAYDSLVFRYLSRSSLGAERILGGVIPDPGKGSAEELARRTRVAGGHARAPDGDTRPKGDAGRAWAAYLMAERRPEAETAVEWLQKRGAVTPELRNQWIEYLVQSRKQYQKALETWAAAQGEPGYPGKNRIYDGRFVRDRTGGRMDWALTANPHVAAKLGDGLTLTFDGMENTAYGHLSQQTYLPAGRWRFSAEAEAQGLTTDQRPYFRIHDTWDPRRLDVSTDMAPGRMAVDFTSPAGGSWVTVTLLRRRSEKFDNKIRGTLQVREVRIGGANGGT